MKNYLFSIVIALCFSQSTWAQSQFIFFDGSYEHLRMRAQSSQKPYFLYFYANYTTVAKRLNQQTFTDPSLIEYATNNYLGMKLDGESIIDEGADLAESYQVLYFPAIVIFTPEGKELERIYGFISPQELGEKLEQYANERGAPDVTLAEKAEMQTAKDKSRHLFKLDVKRLKKQGFGVQVGVFQNYRNAFLKLLEYEEEKFHRNVLVHVDESNPQAVQYKLIFGPFYSYDQADNYKKLIGNKEGLKGIVVDLSKLGEEEN
ncbi:thioredoxin fold domain-containing protein [Rapidithrix thailandica]|uniref:Thioredoxin fold domain-containing protein n=1 Tax=Rapidithrix thailandica TaxID=413964 RepID=A0AAW9SB01_9BACT